MRTPVQSLTSLTPWRHWLLLICMCTLLGARPASAVQTVAASYEAEPGVRIAATLELPAATPGKRWPAVVLAVGAGKWGRGWYVALRSRLHAAGVATLSYDKRGFGESTGAFDESLPLVSRDIAAGVNFLRSRADIDGQRIALLGHSQGAAGLPLAAATVGGIAGIVMLQAPIGARGEVFGDGMQKSLTQSGMPADTARPIVAATLAWLEARTQRLPAPEIDRLREAAITAFVAAGMPPEGARGTVQSLDNPMVLSMYDAPLAQDLIRSGSPVLAVYGGTDTVVSAEVCAPMATRALNQHPNALVLVVPGMNHGMQRLDPVPAPKAGERLEDTMPPRMVEAVAHWLSERLR